MATITLAVPDLACGRCVAHIHHLLADVPGVIVHAVDPRRRLVRLEVADPSAVATARRLLADGGYPTALARDEAA